MANVNYAPTGSGPFAGAIGWINFPNLLASGASTIVNDTLRDGSTISFTLLNRHISGTNVSFNGVTAPIAPGAPFGNMPGGYNGISGLVAFYSQAASGYSHSIDFNNIVIKDSKGTTIPNYTIILCDAEITTTVNESKAYTTDGSVWQELGQIDVGLGPTYTGFGTLTVNVLGIVPLTFRSILCATDSPKNVSARINQAILLGGQQAIAFGIVLSKTNLAKVINNRAYSTDQFNLSVTGSTLSSTTITTGNLNGVQTQSAYLYLTPPTTSSSSFVINETMAPGSTGTLSSNYTTTVLNSNMTPGGTVVPVTGNLGGTITLNFGDYILSTILNTAITSTLTATKAVDKSKAPSGDILTYTVVLNNHGPLTIGNTVLIDTIPSGTSFVANSITLNGVTIPGSVAPPSGVNIGIIPLGTTTITFKVFLSSTLPLGSTISNSSFTSGINSLVPNPATISANSNTISALILGNPHISSSKAVSTNYADIGDTLTYTITISNIGNTTAFNVIFIDTIPSSTSIVSNSLRQDGVLVSGSPNPPGVTLPNSIGIGRTSTVTFDVSVVTISSPNPITNVATQSFQYTSDISTTPNTTGSGSSNTNAASTTINNANLQNSYKNLNEPYVTCNDIITYMISIPNVGSTTAINILFVDTVPNGTTLVPNSVIVNGVVQPGANPSTGITIPNIGSGSVGTISFRVQVNC